MLVLVPNNSFDKERHRIHSNAGLKFNEVMSSQILKILRTINFLNELQVKRLGKTQKNQNQTNSCSPFDATVPRKPPKTIWHSWKLSHKYLQLLFRTRIVLMPKILPKMRSGVSEGIRISNNKQNKQKRYELTCEPVTSSESFSPSAQHLYDAATWRMYYRIIGARTKRSESGNKTSQAINSALVEHAQTMVRGETPLKSRFATSPTKSLQEFHESQTSFDFPITSRRSRINSVASEASNDVQFRLEF
jgi:hypothetical protein